MLLLLEPADLREDIKQFVFEDMLNREESFILDLQTRGKLKHFIVKMMYNVSKWRDRSEFKKQYGFLEMSVASFDRSNATEAAEEWNFDGIETIDLQEILKYSVDRKLCTEDKRTDKELVEAVLQALKEMYWYKAEVFTWYVKLGTYQKVADITGIPLSSIYKTVAQAKQEIKNYIQ